MLTVKEIPQTPEVLEKLLNETIQQAVEMSMRILPGMLNQLITQASHTKQLRDDFYKENKDLDGHKDKVGKVLEKLQADNPASTFEDLLKKLGPEVRKQLNSPLSGEKPQKPSLEQLDHLAGLI